MASKPTLTQLVADFQTEAALANQRLQAQEKALDQHDLFGLRERLARVQTKVEELAKARDTSGNRLFQIGVAILAAQFTLIGTLLAATVRK